MPAASNSSVNQVTASKHSIAEIIGVSEDKSRPVRHSIQSILNSADGFPKKHLNGSSFMTSTPNFTRTIPCMGAEANEERFQHLPPSYTQHKRDLSFGADVSFEDDSNMSEAVASKYVDYVPNKVQRQTTNVKNLDVNSSKWNQEQQYRNKDSGLAAPLATPPLWSPVGTTTTTTSNRAQPRLWSLVDTAVPLSRPTQSLGSRLDTTTPFSKHTLWSSVERARPAIAGTQLLWSPVDSVTSLTTLPIQSPPDISTTLTKQQLWSPSNSATSLTTQPLWLPVAVDTAPPFSSQPRLWSVVDTIAPRSSSLWSPIHSGIPRNAQSLRSVTSTVTPLKAQPLWSPLDTPPNTIQRHVHAEVQWSTPSFGRILSVNIGDVTKHRAQTDLPCGAYLASACHNSQNNESDEQDEKAEEMCRIYAVPAQKESLSRPLFNPSVLPTAFSIKSEVAEDLTDRTTSGLNSVGYKYSPEGQSRHNQTCHRQEHATVFEDSHRSAGTSAIKCSKCGQRFSCESSLRRHMLRHDDVIFSCNGCGRKYTRQDSVRRHERKCRSLLGRVEI